jgi:hypothetical protein
MGATHTSSNLGANNNNPSQDNALRNLEDGNAWEAIPKRSWRCLRCPAPTMDRPSYVAHMLDAHEVRLNAG